LSDLKKKNGSNVVKLGDITVGTYYHRALLFKFLCDQLDLMAELNRADFPVSWNLVIKQVATKHKTEKNFESFVVDLMSDPGKLYAVGSEDSRKYISGAI
jgi:hypothetical protein